MSPVSGDETRRGSSIAALPLNDYLFICETMSQAGTYSPFMQGMHCMPCQLPLNQKKLMIIFLKKYLKNFLDFNLRTFSVSVRH